MPSVAKSLTLRNICVLSLGIGVLGGVSAGLLDLDHLPSYLGMVLPVPANILHFGQGRNAHSVAFVIGVLVFAYCGGLFGLTILKRKLLSITHKVA